MADSINAFTVYSSLELQINEFVQQLNRASQLLDSTLQNMESAVSSLNIQPVEVRTEIVVPDISSYEIPSEILNPDFPDMPVSTTFSVPSEIESPDIPFMPEEPTFTVHTETEPIEPVTVPPPDDKTFIQKIKDSFSSLKNTVNSIPENIALKFVEMEVKIKNTVNSIPSNIIGKFKEMGTNILNTFKSFPSDVAKKFSEMKDSAVEKIKSIPSSIAGVITSIPSKIGSGLKNIGTNIANAFKSGVESAKNALKELPEKASEVLKETGEKLKSIAETVTKACTVAVSAVSAGVVAFGKSAVDTGAEFDKSMSQVAATMGKTNDEITDLRAFAQEMGRTTAFSAKESADALNYMALAGYDAETSMAMLPNVLNLASAGGMELALASDMITDSQSALGLSLDETTLLVDKMAKASSKSNTSVSQLGDAILTVGGTAKKLKGGTTELATVLGILADNGIKGSEGGTALRNIMNSLISPTEEAIAMLESMGTTLYDEAGNMRSLNDVFSDLKKGMSGLATQAEKDQVLTTIFNARDLKSAEALISNVGDRFNELSTEIDNCSGAADAMAKTQLDNLAGDVTLFQSALEGAKIAVSDHLTPALRDFVTMGSDAMGEIALAFNNSDDFEEAVFKMGRYMQKYIAQFIGKIVDAIPKVINVATTLINSLGQAIIKNIPKLANSAVQLLKGFAENITRNAPTAIKGFSDMLKSVSDWLKENGKTLISSGIEMIKSISKGISDNLPNMISSVIEILSFIVETITDNLPLLLDSAFNIIGAVGQGIVTNLPLLVDSVLEIVKSIAFYLSENLPEMIPAIIDVVLQIVETLTDPETLSELIDAALAIIIGLADGIINSLPNLLDRVPTIVQNIVDVIVENVPKLIDAAIEIIAKLGEYLIDPENLVDILDAGVEIVVSLVKGIGSVLDKLVKMAEEMIQAIADTIGLGEYRKYGIDIIDGFMQGVRDKLDEWNTFWENVGGTIYDLLHHSTPEKGPLKDDDKWGGDLMDNLINGVVSKEKSLSETIGDVADFFTVIGDTVGGTFYDVVQGTKLFFQNIFNNISDFFGDIAGKCENFLKEIKGVFTELQNHIKTVFDNVKRFISDFTDNWQSGVKSIKYGVKNIVEKVSDIPEAFEKLVEGALNWGRDLIENFMQGAKEKFDEWNDFWESVGGVVYDLLHHSTPEKGPLKDDDKWGGDLMDNLINGVKSKEKALSDTIKEVAENIRDTFSKPIKVNAGLYAKGTLSGFEMPDISAKTSVPIVAEGGYMTKYNGTLRPSTRENTQNSDGGVTVENLTINLNAEGMKFSSDYEMKRFINFVAEQLKAKNIRDNSGIGGVMF